MHTLLAGLLLLAPAAPQEPAIPSATARELAAHAAEAYGEPAVAALAELVAFDTFARPDVPNAEHPSFRAMTAWLERTAGAFGLDFADHGAVVVIGLGDAEERLGVVTHGDVQPADASKWARSPFELDTGSEPGLLVGRGTEDDKGPIVCALYAMKAIAEREVPLARRIELIVSYTEESDWAPFQAFLAANPPPELNVAIDAEYPVVIAEKGWCSVNVSFPLGTQHAEAGRPVLAAFTGGFFLSQVPEDAAAVVAGATDDLERRLRARAAEDGDARFAFERAGARLTILATGRSAHSSKPDEGVNAITHLARLLASEDWPANGPAWMVRFVDDLVGTGTRAERFGDLAYSDPFMGPLTLSFGTLEEQDGRLVGSINLRRPVGRGADEVRASIDGALDSWRRDTDCPDVVHDAYVGEPHAPVRAPHVPVLLATFRHYTGIEEAEPISIGGGTHARLVPNGVNFGPAMPGETYTGHSEHEFLSREQFVLNLRMYTSLLVDLAMEK